MKNFIYTYLKFHLDKIDKFPEIYYFADESVIMKEIYYDLKLGVRKIENIYNQSNINFINENIFKHLNKIL